MRSASPEDAGIGRTTTSDAAGVAKTASADFKWDFTEQSTSNPFAAATRNGERRHGRRYRGPDHPLATGDGLA